LCITRDCKNNCKFVFGVDYKRLIRDKSRFGSLLNTSYVDIINSLLRSTIVRNMSILRIDAKQYSKEDTSASLPDSSDSEDSAASGAGLTVDTTEVKAAYTVVDVQRKQYPMKGRSARTPEEVVPTGTPTNKILGSIDEILLTYGSDTAMPLAFRHFNVADYQVSLIRGIGNYQYGVKLQIEDNILKYLLSKVKQLRLMIEVLTEYYEEASRPCNYNSFTQSFFPHFIEMLFAGPNPDAVAQRWRRPVNILVEINKIFNFNTYPTPEDLQELAENLLYQVNPFTASPDSILEVIGYANFILFLLEDYVGSDPSDASSDSSTDSTPEGGSQASRYFIETEHYFAERFRTGLLNNTGFDYLGCDDDGL
jgi:hypothetical protein